MPRPQRCRRICKRPDYCEFSVKHGNNKDVVTLTEDEYEVIRLVDYEKKTHAECAKIMDISRTTVTEMYENIRYKLADSLVNGKSLVISGGNYRLCDGSAAGICGNCRMQSIPENYLIIRKEENIMRIAVTYENGEIFGHFGHTEQFKIYDVEDGKVVSEQVVPTNGQGHGALAGFLNANKVDTLICGGIGGGAQMALAQAGIKLYGGVSGSADKAVSEYLAGRLDFNSDVHCDHHDHEHGNGCGSHTCGEHGCGNH